MVWLILLKVCHITTFHYMNCYLMGTQFILLSLGNKWNQSADISKQWSSDFCTERKEGSCAYSQIQEIWCLPCSSQESHYFLPFSDNSIHVQFIQEVTQHSLKVNHSAHNRSLLYNHTITIFMSAPADGKTIPMPYYLPFSCVVLIHSCEPFLMKSVMLNHLGIWWACNFTIWWHE